MARLLVMLRRLLGVVFPLRDALVKQRIGRVHRHVIADRAIAAQHLVHHVLAVDRIFQRHPQIVVQERLGVAMHDEHIMTRALHTLHRQTGCTVQQGRNLGIDPVDQMHLPRLQRAHARGRVVDRQDLDLVHMTTAAVPVIRVLLEQMPHAGLIRLDHIGAGADPCGRIVETAIRLDHQVIIAQQERQVGIRRVQPDDEHVALDLHRGDAAHDAQRTRFAVLVGMALHRAHHILGGQRLAVVELHTRPDLEHPGLRIRRRLDALRQTHLKLAVLVHIHQRLAELVQHVIGHGAGRQRRIKRVGALAARHTHPHHAALDRARRMNRLRIEGARHRDADTQRAHTAHELPARNPAHPGPHLEVVNLLLVDLSGHRRLPVCVCSLGAILAGLSRSGPVVLP